MVSIHRGAGAPEIAFDGRMSRFEVPPAAADLELTAHTGAIDPPAMGATLLVDSGHVWQAWRDGEIIEIRCFSESRRESPYRIVRIEPGFRRASIVLDPLSLRDARTVDLLEYPIGELLFTGLLSIHGGLEVHSSGAVDREGRGTLLVGHSGAGKTTSARLLEAGGFTLLSDDRVVLRPDGDGVAIHGTPWHGEGGMAMPSHAPLRRILFLEHGTRNRMQPLAHRDALARLLTCSFLPIYDQAMSERSIAFAQRVVESVPCCSFEFVPEASIVDFLSK